MQMEIQNREEYRIVQREAKMKRLLMKQEARHLAGPSAIMQALDAALVSLFSKDRCGILQLIATVIIIAIVIAIAQPQPQPRSRPNPQHPCRAVRERLDAT